MTRHHHRKKKSDDQQGAGEELRAVITAAQLATAAMRLAEIIIKVISGGTWPHLF